MGGVFSWEGGCAALTLVTYFDLADQLPPETRPWFRLATISLLLFCILVRASNRIAQNLLIIAMDDGDDDDDYTVEHPDYEVELPEDGEE